MKKYLAIYLVAIILSASGCNNEKDPEEAPSRNLPGLGIPRGLVSNTSLATPGYVLFNPLLSDTTFLINLDGQVVKTWTSAYGPSGWFYLKENGTLARGGRDPENTVFDGGGQGGWLQEFNWNGELLWQYKFSTDKYLAHHDVAIMPNGNYLVIAWDLRTPEEALAGGVDPDKIPKAGVWPDMVVELEPIGNDSAAIVWEWHLWDHAIQDLDQTKNNYGVIADHPELLNLDLIEKRDSVSMDDLDERRAKNNASTNDTPENQGSDIFHFNAIDYHAELDQIVLSSPNLDEILIIDHSTTSKEAAGHEGGRWGKGGDFLYRWGNPQNYDQGDSTDLKLGGQHDVRWIAPGLPGAGHLTVFDNNVPYSDPGYSAVLELETPLTDSGYILNENNIYGPEHPFWQYIATDTVSFYSPFISGSHRMANGNTFVTEGARGRFFEVNSDGEILWEYLTPYAGSSRMPDGTFPQPVGPFTYATFRATHISQDHPAIANKVLDPISPQPSVHKHKE